MTLSEINEKNKAKVLQLQVKPWPWHEHTQSIEIRPGSQIYFSTRFQFGDAKVLDIDFGREHCVQLNWANDRGDARTEWFKPDEFLSMRRP